MLISLIQLMILNVILICGEWAFVLYLLSKNCRKIFCQFLLSFFIKYIFDFIQYLETVGNSNMCLFV